MIKAAGETVTVDILVSPRASRERIGPVHGDRVKVSVTSAPVDGAANKAVVRAFARALKIPVSRIEVRTGLASRRKTVSIAGVSAEAIRALVR